MENIDSRHVETLRARLTDYLKGKPFAFNPDAGLVESVLTSLAARFQKHGEDYCPCRRVTGDPAADKKIICPCAYHEEEIQTQGRCHCHLFAKI